MLKTINSDMCLFKLLAFLWENLQNDSFLDCEQTAKLENENRFSLEKKRWGDFFLENEFDDVKETWSKLLDSTKRPRRTENSWIGYLTKTQNSISIKKFTFNYTLALFEALDEFLYATYQKSYPVKNLYIPLTQNEYHILRRGNNRKSSHEMNQTGFIGESLQFNWVLNSSLQNGNKITPKVFGNLKNYNFLKEKDFVTVLAATFDDGVEAVLFEKKMKHLTLVNYKSLADEELRWQTIESVLLKGVLNQVDIIVMPELSISNILREKISLWLNEKPHPFSMVLPGSYHQEDKKGDIYNNSELLDENGNAVLMHKKLRKFKGKLEKSDDVEYLEYIKVGSEIELLETHLGIMSIPICLDYCTEVDTHIWRKLRVEWLLVPSLSTATSAHLKVAEQLGRSSNAISIVANQPTKEKFHDRGFIFTSDGKYTDFSKEFDSCSALVMLKKFII